MSEEERKKACLDCGADDAPYYAAVGGLTRDEIVCRKCYVKRNEEEFRTRQCGRCSVGTDAYGGDWTLSDKWYCEPCYQAKIRASFDAAQCRVCCGKPVIIFRDGVPFCAAHREGMRLPGVYIASKTVHAPKWRALRAAGHPILDTWIDESGDYETLDWRGLWRRIRSEIYRSCALIVYYEEGEILKGAFLEMGIALAFNVPVFWAGNPSAFNLLKQDGISFVETVEEALRQASFLSRAHGENR